MAKSKSQQATSLAKQYTADQLAAAMIYGETRAGVDAKGNMADQLAGVRELRAADNRARATGKDISGILTQPKQFQGLNPQSLQAITNPDSLKNPGDRAAARAALDKAKDYFAGKYEAQVGKGTPYENVTSFNQASEAYNTKKSGAVPGSHVAGGAHNFFTTTDMAKRLQQAQATQQASQPGGVTTETANVATPTAVITPQGTAVAAPKGEISAGQSIQGSNVIERNLGPMGQKEDESSDYGGRGPAFPGTGTATPLYQVPKLEPYQGTTLGAGNVAGIPQYPYSSQNKSVGQGTGQGQGQGTGQGGGSGGGASGGSSGDAGASGLPSGYGDGTVAGGGYGSFGDGAGQGAGQGTGAGWATALLPVANMGLALARRCHHRLLNRKRKSSNSNNKSSRTLLWARCWGRLCQMTGLLAVGTTAALVTYRPALVTVLLAAAILERLAIFQMTRPLVAVGTILVICLLTGR